MTDYKKIVSKNRHYIKYIIIGAIGLLVLFVLCCVMCKCKRRRRRIACKDKSRPTVPPIHNGDTPSVHNNSKAPVHNGGMARNEKVNPNISPMLSSIDVKMPFCSYTYEELMSATKGFSPDSKLGEGGFGVVYKGVLNKKEIAVKKLKVGSSQGDLEFKAEVEIISRVHHKNLVSLIGYCNLMGERMLVFEFLPNQTLDVHLSGKNVRSLNWQQRRKIAIGSAKGLAYLHEDCSPKIIHRDIKASNILLDFNFEPKVADFGLAKFKSINQTHVSTRIMGTFGYVDPEFVASGKLTEKADVYAFGVILLELITGKPSVWTAPNNDQISLVSWTRPLISRALEQGNYEELVDRRLGTDYDPYGMSRMIECAASAVNQSARRRPLMSQIVQKLQGDIMEENLNDDMTTEYFGINPNSYNIKPMMPDSRGFTGSELSDKYSTGQHSLLSTTNEPIAR